MGKFEGKYFRSEMYAQCELMLQAISAIRECHLNGVTSESFGDVFDVRWTANRSDGEEVELVSNGRARQVGLAKEDIGQ